MSKLILVGEAPGGRGHEALPALEGLVGRRLAGMLGLTLEEYLETVDRRNLFETPEEGKRWDRREALLRAIRMMAVLPHEPKAVLLGKRVADAFRVSQYGLYEWVAGPRIWSGDTVWLTHVPHPSGRNRLLNDPSERQRMSEFLREAYHDATQR